jgi:hypothetical protein
MVLSATQVVTVLANTIAMVLYAMNQATKSEKLIATDQYVMPAATKKAVQAV